MYKVEEETLKTTLKPFDIVFIKATEGVGYIAEVSVNQCQSKPEHQIRYSITHLYKSGKTAWYKNDELEYQGNLFVKIAEGSCHPFSSTKGWTSKLMKRGLGE